MRIWSAVAGALASGLLFGATAIPMRAEEIPPVTVVTLTGTEEAPGPVVAEDPPEVVIGGQVVSASGPERVALLRKNVRMRSATGWVLS